jgi:hypothetical protein
MNLWFHFSQGMVLFWWWCLLGMLCWWCCRRPCRWPPPAGSTLRHAFPSFFNWDLSYNTASPVATLFSLNYSMYVCVEMRYDFVLLQCCDVKGVDLWWWRMREYLVLVVCVLLECSREQKWCYIPWLLLIGMPWLVWFTRHLSWLIWFW